MDHRLVLFTSIAVQSMLGLPMLLIQAVFVKCDNAFLHANVYTKRCGTQ